MPSARSLMIISPEGHSGKATTALGVIDLLVRQGLKVGVYRPVFRESESLAGGHDETLEMLLEHANSPLTYEDACGVTYEEIHEKPDEAMAKIVAKYHEIAAKADVLVVLGTDYTDVSSSTELAINCRIAANIGAPVLLVVSGLGRNDEAANATASMALTELKKNHAVAIGAVYTRLEGLITKERKERLCPEPDLPIWTVPEEGFLGVPTVGQLKDAVNGQQFLGDPALLTREASDVVVGAMSLRHLLDRIADGDVVITAGDRTEVLIGLLSAQKTPEFPTLAGIILTGGYRPKGNVNRLVKAMSPNVPVILTDMDTYPAARAASRCRGRISASSARKIDLALQLFENNVDGKDLLDRIAVKSTGVVTPVMFEYSLMEQAGKQKERIVLPEGSDDRILRAASTVLARGIAKLIILGDEGKIRQRAAELGLDISGAKIISPHDPEYVEKYAKVYTKLREKKGMTLERAREIVQDVSYFGTMMVYCGDADGMVSGAAHTTAHTIRPSFETIKTKPGISSVSGVFLMCLEDQVLVYGDCAVIPDPTAEQLADIAISSAATAQQFGIEPRIAMLSYSTGDSGTGADVDKVREATALVRERRPDLEVEGPIQYDAAVDAAVAASKLPNSKVAGKATVFVFPDLNTGNNTYKAVQRSSGAVAIGPVLQGLNQPVNDLSRGALVEDIVNTIAITAIQAQAEKAEGNKTAKSSDNAQGEK
ncbi:MAG: phosphate acetyltransferase [Cellulomonadaceae bacterium]|nr:phosphate acetyltransferase [Cellulomonadaceae bacterium]